MKKKVKHPCRMTGDEVMAHIFDPKAVKHIKKHVQDLDAKKEKPTEKEAK
ncbi:MAG: hypothetical protein ACLQBD_13000 [Syntrophobacteraceae bacterium]